MTAVVVPEVTPPAQTFGDRIRVVLVRPLKSGNVGSAARAMKNMGLRRMVLVAPREDDPEQARWMAPGATDVLDAAVRVETVAEAVAGCHWVVGTTVRGRKLRWPVLEPQAFARQALATPGEIAILFGPEDAGLDNDDLLRCQALLTIPTDLQPSLNLAQAVLIVAHHLFLEACAQGYLPPARRRRSRRGHRDNPARPSDQVPGRGEVPATMEFQAEAVAQALEVLGRTSYLLGRSPDQVRLTLSQLLQRSAPSLREVSILMGMLAKIRYALEHPGED